MTSTLETLLKARDLISDPKRWTQRSFAVHEDGGDCLPEDDGAVCFCAEGALIRASGSKLTHGYPKELEKALEAEMGDIWHFNDTHTHAEVLAAFDAAIEKARAAE